jgi:uncharacterized protein (TIGR01777 family)
VRVLLTGASGLIGTALTDRLLSEGHSVTRLVRGTPAAGGPTTEVTWFPESGAVDLPGLDDAGPFDGLVHLAGAGIGDKRWSAARKETILKSRTGATRLLTTSLLKLDSRPPVLVSASAVGWYGLRGDEELTEASTAGTGFLAEVCKAWEEAAESASAVGIRTVFLRTGIVLSPDGGALGRQLPLFRVGLGGRMGSGSQYRSWITLEDEVSVILRCLQDDRLSGPVNATAPHPATDGELAKAMGAALHRPSVVPVPATALRLALGSEMAEQLVLGGQRVLPAVLLANGFTFAHPELDEAVRSVLAPAD